MTTTSTPTDSWAGTPGTSRCDRGWDDDTGHSWGCHAPGIHEINGEWVCAKHTTLTSITNPPTRDEVAEAFQWLAAAAAGNDLIGATAAHAARVNEAYRVLGHDAYQIITRHAQSWAQRNQEHCR